MIRPRRQKRERMGVREAPQFRCPGHLQWIRGCKCALEGRAGHVCAGPVEAAHVRTGTDGAMGVKPSDYWAVPFCRDGAHAPQHSVGEAAFERANKIDMKSLARQYAAISPHRTKWLGEGRSPAHEGRESMRHALKERASEPEAAE